MQSPKINYIKSLKNIKIVLGNGFDLHLKLKTEYNDFFESNDSINKFKEKTESFNIRISQNYLTNQNNEIPFPKETSKPCSVWHLFFFLFGNPKTNQTNKKWCDIEQLMLNSFTIIPQYSSNYFWNDVFEAISSKRNIYTNNDYTDKVIFCAAYMMQKYNEKGDIKTKEVYYKYLMAELNSFEIDFGIYIKKEMSKNPKYLNKADRFISQLCGEEEDHLKIMNLTSIDSFNYININSIGSTSFNKEKFHNINGSVDNLIFGIDSSKIEINDPAFQFTKTSRRLVQETNKDNLDIRDDFQNVIIYGHSLNSQDYSYFFPIFDYLKLNDTSKSTHIIFAYSIYDEKISEKIRTEQVKNITKLIYSYEEYIHSEIKIIEKRLMDNLFAKGRIILIEI
jgi:hypothetical protein